MAIYCLNGIETSAVLTSFFRHSFANSLVFLSSFSIISSFCISAILMVDFLHFIFYLHFQGWYCKYYFPIFSSFWYYGYFLYAKECQAWARIVGAKRPPIYVESTKMQNLISSLSSRAYLPKMQKTQLYFHLHNEFCAQTVESYSMGCQY